MLIPHDSLCIAATSDAGDDTPGSAVATKRGMVLFTNVIVASRMSTFVWCPLSSSWVQNSVIPSLDSGRVTRFTNSGLHTGHAGRISTHGSRDGVSH